MLNLFLNPDWYFESILPKNTESWLYKHLSKILRSLIICLLAYRFYLLVRLSFLKTGVTSVSFISEGHLPNSNDLLNSWRKMGVKMSILSLTFFVGMCEFGEDFEESSLFNYFSITVCVTLLKQKVLLFSFWHLIS